MKIRTLVAALALAWALGMNTTIFAADGVISKVQLGESHYCNLRFPAIQKDTLFTDHPVLQDPDTKDVVDFYGPCDHDPLGEKEVRQQREDHRREQRDRT